MGYRKEVFNSIGKAVAKVWKAFAKVFRKKMWQKVGWWIKEFFIALSILIRVAVFFVILLLLTVIYLAEYAVEKSIFFLLSFIVNRKIDLWLGPRLEKRFVQIMDWLPVFLPNSG